jgi:glutamate N-acetyltransferase/amino-acid N-acetyltransferase
MTTDTRKKDGAFETEIDSKTVRIGGMAKGSGMIHPNMATLLCFITTDVSITKEMLDKALKTAVKRSFNRLTVDGDTSTNDTVLVMASGEAGNTTISAEGPDFTLFTDLLQNLCIKLTRAMARDGEGAGKLVTVKVTGAASEDDAETLSKSVAASSLVKAACFGADANWGRVLCAMGYSGAEFDPAAVDVRFVSKAGEVLVCSTGSSIPFSEETAKKVLSEEEIEIVIKAGTGKGEAAAWGCDLTYDYVKINGDYRS